MPSVDVAASDTEQTASARRRARELLAQLAAVVGDDQSQAGAALARAQAIVDILVGLTDDDDILSGALLLPLLEAGVLTPEQAIATVSAPAHRIATELQRLGSLNISMPASSRDGRSIPSLSGNQAEGLRKMLLAIVTDPRLVLVKLAAQLQQLRDSKDAPEEERERLAYETREVYAPLANRLGVWQLKWELEDLSFRYLDPENYKRIAGWLAAKRTDRERYIGEVIEVLRQELAKVNITDAEIAGRPKHIYSIWRKMQRKGLQFDQLYDVRAVRVLVNSIADCYAALGIVHGMWPYIPGEFDDYIATPKDNSVSIAAHRGDRPGQAAVGNSDSHARDARSRRARRRRALALQGRRPEQSLPTTRRSSGCGRSSSRANVARKPKASFSIACARSCSRIASTRSHLAAKSSICREARRRSTSPITCTPISVIAAGARRSTAAWCR